MTDMIAECVHMTVLVIQQSPSLRELAPMVVAGCEKKNLRYNDAMARCKLLFLIWTQSQHVAGPGHVTRACSVHRSQGHRGNPLWYVVLSPLTVEIVSLLCVCVV